MNPEISSADDLDASDPLALYRGRFHMPLHDDSAECIYLCGNSLGLQPKSAAEYVIRELELWKRLGVGGHFDAGGRWFSYHKLLTESTARLAGALPGEVVVMNSLTVNLHLMLSSFYRPTAERHKIAVEANPFPSDLFAVKSQIAFHGFNPDESLVQIQPRQDEATIRTEDVARLIEDAGGSIALVLLGAVHFQTGQAFEIEPIARACRQKGVTLGLDLAHALGNIPLQLHNWGVDFAVWCSYKYLNGGPGSVGGCFVHDRHTHGRVLPRLAGWWGHEQASRFAMPSEFRPIPGAEGWQQSNPPILQMAALRAAMDVFDEVGMAALRQKSLALTGYMEDLIDHIPAGGPEIITPRDPGQRGCQLSLRVGEGGRALQRRLAERGVVCDWREPDVIRAAPVPLYNSFADVSAFVRILGEEWANRS